MQYKIKIGIFAVKFFTRKKYMRYFFQIEYCQVVGYQHVLLKNLGHNFGHGYYSWFDTGGFQLAVYLFNCRGERKSTAAEST